MPFLDRFWFKNPVRMWLSKIGFVNSSTPVVVFAQRRLAERVESDKTQPPNPSDILGRGFLSRFLEVHEKDPEFISINRVLSLTVTNMFAGSDTTAISLRSILYNLIRHPEDYERLMEELNKVPRNENGIFRWNDVKDLAILSAVIKEGLRCHPATGLPLERVIPNEGANVCGRFIPGGITVGCNAWAIHQDQAISGPDACRFRPSRWTEAN